MERNLLIVDELVDFYEKRLTIVVLTYTQNTKIATFSLFGLLMLIQFFTIICAYFYKGQATNWTLILMAVSVCILILMYRIRVRALRKRPGNMNVSQLRFLALESFLKSKMVSRQNLVRIQNIIENEQKHSKKTYSFILPGTIAFIPLWNAFLTKYFTDTTKEFAIEFFVECTVLLFFIGFLWWGTKTMVMSLVNERQALLKDIFRLIDELLINGYGAEEK